MPCDFSQLQYGKIGFSLLTHGMCCILSFVFHSFDFQPGTFLQRLLCFCLQCLKTTHLGPDALRLNNVISSDASTARDKIYFNELTKYCSVVVGRQRGITSMEASKGQENPAL